MNESNYLTLNQENVPCVPISNCQQLFPIVNIACAGIPQDAALWESGDKG